MTKLTVLLTFLFLFFNACESNAQNKLAPDEFQAYCQKETTAQIVDVRTPEEFNGGHIEGAVNINFYDADFAQRIAKLDKEKPVMVYCAAGGRSGKSATQLTKLGFTKVYDLSGGMGAWQAKGKPVVK